jgi:hypothetical protein
LKVRGTFKGVEARLRYNVSKAKYYIQLGY